MKKKILLMIVILMLTILPFAFADNVPVLKATLLKYEPSPAEPGNYVDVWIKLENIGNGAANDATIQLVAAYPFSLDPSQNATQEIGLLGGQKDYVVDFKLRVDDKAVDGTNTVKVRFNPDPVHGGVWQENTFNINIQTHDATISVIAVKTEPEEISPGEKATLTITVKNMASSTLKDVSVGLNLFSITSTSSVTGTSTTIFDLPFVPIGSTTEKKISQLGSGETFDFVYELAAYPNAESKAYKIPVEIRYNDRLGKNYTKNDIVGVIINSVPKITASIDSTDIYGKGRNGKVSIKIVNEGVNNIKFLTVTLNPSDKYDILSSSNEIYIGKLDSDDYQTADFRIYLRDGNEIPMPVTLNYMDSNNKEYTQEETLTLKIISAEQAGKASGPGFLTYFIIIVIIAVIGFFVYRRFRKKARK